MTQSYIDIYQVLAALGAIEGVNRTNVEHDGATATAF